MPITPESGGRVIQHKGPKPSKAPPAVQRTEAEIQFELEAEAEAKRRKIQVSQQISLQPQRVFDSEVWGMRSNQRKANM